MTALCSWCDSPITGPPVRDPEAVSWIGKGAPAFCSTTCMDAHDEQQINAEGNRGVTR